MKNIVSDRFVKSYDGLLNQLKAWRLRWRPLPEDEDHDQLINRYCAETFNDQAGKAFLDYLIETYYKPLQSGSTPLTTTDLAENNGKQLVVVDILVRFDMGMHPMAFIPAELREEEKPMDVRQ